MSSISPAAIANEFDILGEEVPTKDYVIDDAGVLSKSGKKALSNLLKTSEIKTGYRLTAITTRKLEFENTLAAGDAAAAAAYHPRQMTAAQLLRVYIKEGCSPTRRDGWGIVSLVVLDVNRHRRGK